MKRCPQCGAELPDRFRFCMDCGADQGAAPAPTQARLDGSGAIAQGSGAVAAGAGGIAIGGNVQGNVYVGPPTQDPVKALRIYRRVMISTGRHLSLRGVDLGASDPAGGQQRLDLAQVYVDLNTTTQIPLAEEDEGERRRSRPEQRETRPLRALEAAIEHRRLVILGDPGSGKSTFVGHLALCLAAHGLEPQVGWLARLPGWPEVEMEAVPIPVVLRDFARWLPADVEVAEPRHLWGHIVSRLDAQNVAFAADALQQALEGGKAIVLLDGLDEIPTQGRRILVRDAVSCFAQRYPRSRIVVTCRVLSYQDPAWRLGDFPTFELASFDEEKIDSFIGAWYAELARLNVVKAEDADGLSERLKGAVRRPDLWRLATNPLLLTVMALVHTHKGRLPDARAQLYEDTVDILLWRWEQVKAGGSEDAPPLRQLLLDAGRTDVDLKRVLWRLAFEAHGAGGVEDGEGLADIGELKLQKALATLHPAESLDWARRVIAVIKTRAGLLLERVPEVYTFPHRTFQEYMAGGHLSAQAGFAQCAAKLAEEGALWRQVVLLSVGRLVYLAGDTDKPLALVGELCPTKAVDEKLAWQKAWLAGDVLLESGLNRVRDSALGRDLVERVRHRLADLVSGGRLSAVERAAAGNALARLGDPRGAVTTLDEMAFCYVPAGPFQMGDGRERHLNEALSYDYWIAQYPVTVAQFQAFVEADGYQDTRYWQEAREAGVWREGRVKSRFGDESWDESWAAPYDWGTPFNLPNHPVVGVTWYEALAFARWLTEVWRTAGWLGPESTVRLPSEAEWEKAVRGGMEVPERPWSAAIKQLRARKPMGELVPNSNPVRRYPWGDEPVPDWANYDDTGVGATSTAGCFPGGASPYGVLDMSGNVWEWTRSLWGKDPIRPEFKYPYDLDDGREDESADDDVARVLRGGAFNHSAYSVRCAFRYRFNPDLGYSSCGFRVVVSPG